MILASENAAALLRSGGYQGTFVADVIVDGERVLADQPLSGVSLKWDRAAKVRGAGRCVFYYSDDLGRSIIPETLTSWLTPVATYLNISYKVSAGDFTEKILLGKFKVIRVTDPVDFRKAFQGRYISVGSSVGLQLADPFRVTDRERFPAPYGPTDLSSVWAELGRLTGLPLSRNVTDSPISRAVTYQENRLDAVFDLATMLAGVPFVDQNGYVTIDTDEWPAESEEFATGSTGVLITRTPGDLSDEAIYNQVVVRSHDAGQTAILATAELPSGPLRYGGPFGRVPYFASSQYVTTTDQAAAYAAELLPQVSEQRVLQFAIEMVPDPRRQVGDVVAFDWDGLRWLSRIQQVSLGDSGPMVCTVEAQLLGPVVAPEELWYPALDVFPLYDLYPAGGTV